MTRRSYAGGAVQALLDGAITSTSNTISCDSLDGWPTGSEGPGPFYALIDKDVPGSEEKVLCSSRTGNSLTVITRGADGTTARSHSLGATIEHIHAAVDSDEANEHVNTAQGVHGLDPGDPVVGETTAATLTNKTLDTAVNTITVNQSDVTGLATSLDAKVDVAGDTMTGQLKAVGDPVAAEDLARKAYVDTQDTAVGDAASAALASHVAAPDPHPQYLTPAEGDAAYVNVSGDTMTGQLALVGDPVSANDAARKAYVDAEVVAHTEAFQLPDPADSSVGPNANAISVGGSAGVWGPLVTPVEMTYVVPAAPGSKTHLWIEVKLFAWMLNGGAAGSDTRGSIKVTQLPSTVIESEATTELYTNYIGSAGTQQPQVMTRRIRVTAGQSYKIETRGYRVAVVGGATHQINYARLSVVPLKWD